jgi:hypothetical protein
MTAAILVVIVGPVVAVVVMILRALMVEQATGETSAGSRTFAGNRLA